MSEILSTNKPTLKSKPEPKIEYNDRSYQSYIKNGFADFIPHRIEAPRNRIQKFLNEVDIRKGPIERTVTTMVRLKAIDWNSPKKERKEWIYYTEDWNGVNWLGIPRKVCENVEGKYNEVITRPKLDERTGEHIDNIFSGTREVFYIPFTKAKVDEIIKNSVGSDKSNIRFVVKFASEDGNDTIAMSVRNQFSYEVFVNATWDKLYEWQYWPKGDANRPVLKDITKTANKLEFKPS